MRDRLLIILSNNLAIFSLKHFIYIHDSLFVLYSWYLRLISQVQLSFYPSHLDYNNLPVQEIVGNGDLRRRRDEVLIEKEALNAITGHWQIFKLIFENITLFTIQFFYFLLNIFSTHLLYIIKSKIIPLLTFSDSEKVPEEGGCVVLVHLPAGPQFLSPQGRGIRGNFKNKLFTENLK